MKRNQSSLIWGVLLVAFGGLMLLDRLGLVSGIGGMIWAVLFAGAGAAFLVVYVANSQRWWAIIPGFSLLGLGILIGLDTLAPRLGNLVGAPIFLGAIGASFGAVYLTRRQAWWAIIPCGTMLSVAAVTFLEALNVPFDAGLVILPGLGLTFAAVALTGRGQGNDRRWALIPAGILLLIGVLVMADSFVALRFAWPLLIVAAGAFFVVRGLGRGKASSTETVQPQPAAQPEPSTQKLDDGWNKEQS